MPDTENTVPNSKPVSVEAVVSLLDDEHDARVRGLWKSLEERFGLQGIYSTPYPHFSYHSAERYDSVQAEMFLKREAASLEPFQVGGQRGWGLFPRREADPLLAGRERQISFRDTRGALSRPVFAGYSRKPLLPTGSLDTPHHPRLWRLDARDPPRGGAVFGGRGARVVSRNNELRSRLHERTGPGTDVSHRIGVLNA